VRARGGDGGVVVVGRHERVHRLAGGAQLRHQPRPDEPRRAGHRDRHRA
jgi:hypothetical protein